MNGIAWAIVVLAGAVLFAISNDELPQGMGFVLILLGLARMLIFKADGGD